MASERVSEAGDARRTWLPLCVSLAPDVAGRGDTGPTLTEAQFVALTQMHATVDCGRGAGPLGPCAHQ